jgi:hypothetical protein
MQQKNNSKFSFDDEEEKKEDLSLNNDGELIF